MFSGIGQMIQHPMETINVPSNLIMGRWFQVYKAAVNFDVYRTQIYCPVAYCIFFYQNPKKKLIFKLNQIQ